MSARCEKCGGKGFVFCDGWPRVCRCLADEKERMREARRLAQQCAAREYRRAQVSGGAR